MTRPGTQNGVIRLLIADDSPTVRAVIRTMIGTDAGIAVVNEATNGIEAVAMARTSRPDVVLMDIRMPEMDGYEATERIMGLCATPIIAFSSLTTGSEAQASIDMLAAGALDVMAKPDLADPGAVAQCAEELRRKVRVASKVAVVRHLRKRGAAAAPAPPPPRARADARYAVVGIGASSGGPAALKDLLSRLPADFPLPILVVQHITAGFTEGLIDWLRHHIRLPIRLCRSRDHAEPGSVLVAPEGRQMEALDGSLVQAVSPVSRGVHLPSVDVLFSSLARRHGGRTVGIILTGMGSDGVEGLKEIRRAGGLTFAQDEETSAVFGMPGEAIRQGAAESVLSPAAMAFYLTRVASAARLPGERHGV